jgi:uncharacterized membrane protein|tara:strand:- start:60292 stop:60537 length:246 start_codon:yes stop_codon:yes gene_type:complete
LASRKISLIKSVSYRVLAISITGLTGYFVTGSLIFAATIVYIDTLLKIVFYYWHERVWERIQKKMKKNKDWRIGTVWEKRK